MCHARGWDLLDRYCCWLGGGALAVGVYCEDCVLGGAFVGGGFGEVGLGEAGGGGAFCAFVLA